MNYEPQLLPTPDHTEYVITLEFQLQRQKDKNRILEERLKNKETFIIEIKQMHLELQSLSEHCRKQLQAERALRHELETKTIREYVEKIADLQHEIKMLKNRERNEDEPYRKYFSKQVVKSGQKGQKVHKNSQKKVEKLLGKASECDFCSNLFTNQKITESKTNEQQDTESEGIQKFIKYFLEMSQFYQSDISRLPDRKKLKASWKWIKDVVKQWNEMSENQQNYQNLLGSLAQSLGLSEEITFEAIIQAIDKLKSSKKQ